MRPAAATSLATDPDVLGAGRLFAMESVTGWMPSPDGRRFLMVRERPVVESRWVLVVEQFLTELAAKVR